MERLTAEWGWDEPYLRQLDNRRRWKVNRVRQERNELVQELNHSYRFLSGFARDNGIEASINQQDMNILGRRLYAAFERKGGKIDLINPGIAQDISEEHLSFHLSNDTDAPGLNGFWSVYRGYLKRRDIRGHEPVKKARSIIELIAWCYFNRLIDLSTRLSIDTEKQASDLNDQELSQLVMAFYQLFPDGALHVPQQNFEQAAYPLRLCLFINVGIDPLGAMSRKGVIRISNQSNPLSYSALRHNLALTVDQVSVNSWGEIVCSHFYGEAALIDCLVALLRQMPPGLNLDWPQIDIRCFCVQRGATIAKRIEELFRDVYDCYYPAGRSMHTRYLLEIEQYIYVLQFRRELPVVQAVRNQDQLYEMLAEPQPVYSHITLDSQGFQKHPLRVISRMGVSGRIQVFYRCEGEQVEVLVQDENGSVFRTVKPWHDEQSLLVPLDHFFQSIAYRRGGGPLQAEGAAVPVQYFEIVAQPGREPRAERRRVRDIKESLRFFNVQAIGEQTWTDSYFYTIYCGDTEFSQFEYGDELYRAVARHITGIRKGHGTYPCYLTDLDLTQVTSEVENRLQTVQFLKFKEELEAQINAELARLPEPKIGVDT
jgi:adenylate cyclase class 1